MTEVIVVHEPVSDSIKRDGFSVLAAFALILPGWWIGSGALQWVGCILFAVIILNRAAGLRRKMTMSIPEARAKLDELEANQ